MKPLLFLLALLLGSCTLSIPHIDDGAAKREVRFAMGSILSIDYYSHDERAAQIVHRCADLAHSLDTKLSNYLEESEISQLNRAGKGEVSKETFKLIKLSKELAHETGGAFDPTVRPLLTLWRDGIKNGALPDEGAVIAAKAVVGYEKIALYPPHRVVFERLGVQIDTGGIGKGYAVDLIAACLKEGGLASAFIDFGGSSMFGVGAPPHSAGWPVSLQLNTDPPQHTLSLFNAGLSVSRAKGKLIEVGGRKLSHIIDPKSGAPVNIDRGAIVISTSATRAEALSKLLIVRGKSALRQLAPPEYGALQEPGELLHRSTGFSKVVVGE